MTSKPHFITLTTPLGHKRRFNAAMIVTYAPCRSGTEITSIDPTPPDTDPSWTVAETPEQIDALLGVTGGDIAAAVMEAMDASSIAIEDKGDDYCAGFDDAHAIFYQRVEAAIAKARGEG